MKDESKGADSIRILGLYTTRMLGLGVEHLQSTEAPEEGN